MAKSKSLCAILLFTFFACGCVQQVPPPQWSDPGPGADGEYAKYLKDGTATITGQAFMTQAGGGVVKGAGREVTLDPATSIGTEWWTKAGASYQLRGYVHPALIFQKARRTQIADADGRFKFQKVPAGRYYIRSEVTWYAGEYGIQGGLVGKLIEAKDGESVDVILNAFAH